MTLTQEQKAEITKQKAEGTNMYSIAKKLQLTYIQVYYFLNPEYFKLKNKENAVKRKNKEGEKNEIQDVPISEPNTS